MGLAKTTVAALTLAGATLSASHQVQLDLLEREVNASMNENSADAVEKDIVAVWLAVRNMIHHNGGNLDF